MWAEITYNNEFYSIRGTGREELGAFNEKNSKGNTNATIIQQLMSHQLGSHLALDTWSLIRASGTAGKPGAGSVP